MARLLLIQSLFLEQMGIMTLSGTAKSKGHDVAVAVGSDRHILSKAQKFSPDVVGFSVTTGNQKRYLQLGQALKRYLNPSPLIIFGGPHASFCPQIVREEGVDIVCRGEGEGALLDILSAIDTENNLVGIKNLALNKNGETTISPLRPLVDLNTISFPDRDIYSDYPIIHDADMVMFMASRGCPYNCSFCFNKKMEKMVRGLGSWVRFRSVENLIEEIDLVNCRKRIRHIDFHDDTFIINREWLFEFLEAYASRFSIPFVCKVRTDLVDIEIARALKSAGCSRVSFGVESGDENLRNLLLKKSITDDQIRNAASILHQVGLPFFTYNMLGLPGERLEEALKTLVLNIEIGTQCAWTSIFQPFPGTQLAEYCLEKGYLKSPISAENLVDTHTSSLLSQPDIDRIARLQKFAYVVNKFPKSLPLVKKLINYNLPTIYYVIHRLSYLILFFRKEYNTTIMGTLRHAWVAWKHYR